MFPSAEAARPDRTGRWPKYVGLALLVLTFLVATLYGYAFVRVVPPISAKVVDAVTAKPIAGINVCLQVDTGGFGKPKVVRTEMARTDDSGRFFFWPSVHEIGGGMVLRRLKRHRQISPLIRSEQYTRCCRWAERPEMCGDIRHKPDSLRPRSMSHHITTHPKLILAEVAATGEYAAG